MWSLTCRRYRALCLAVWGRGGLTVHEALQHSCVAGATGCPRRAHSSELVVSARAPEREQMRKEPRAESLEPAQQLGLRTCLGSRGRRFKSCRPDSRQGGIPCDGIPP
jgi:hypothetical protein